MFGLRKKRSKNMNNYMMIDGNKIEISDETADNFRKQFEAPKLRHGDYGCAYSQNWAHINGQTFWTDPDISAKARISELPDSHFLKVTKEIFNFGDLEFTQKALQEDVTEFRTGSGNTAHIDKIGDLIFECRVVAAGNIDDFIMGLRQLQATKRRQK